MEKNAKIVPFFYKGIGIGIGIYIFLSEYIQLHEFFIDRTV